LKNYKPGRKKPLVVEILGKVKNPEAEDKTEDEDEKDEAA
jgi:hypothetical protein